MNFTNPSRLQPIKRIIDREVSFGKTREEIRAIITKEKKIRRHGVGELYLESIYKSLKENIV